MAIRQTDSEPTAESEAESPDEAAGYATAVRAEQEYVTMLYALLDEARERSERELTSVRARGGAGGTHQARLERDVSAAEHEKRIAQLNLTERGLCFGRTDDDKRDTLYIGRIGLRDDDYELKLIDWRAPAARAFYAATPRNPVGLVRRRHIYTRQRAVTGVDDEVFDLDKLSDKDKSTLSGEAALIAAVSSARTGRMADVVATIQAEQDRVIRADLPGVLVVQGGPGTGKTVAALHRAAYLLYTHRRTLERRGVLVIGPNATFLRYIGQVLPSLGETDVVLHTLGDLFPGVHATDTRDPAAVVKGDERMIRVIRQAVRDRQRVPGQDITVDADGVAIPLRRAAILRARDRARATRRAHNVARKLFVTELLSELARAEARVLDRPFDDDDLPYARERLWSEPGVYQAIDSLWPLLTAERLLADLLGSAQAIRSAASAVLDHSERSRLTRSDHPSRWTVADVPLLDEAAELLGTDDSADLAASRAEARARALEEKYAREVMQITYDANSGMSLAELGLVDAETLAAWNRDNGASLSTAERAEADRSWAYGHVIVDEAQELSAMAWRMVLRRNPVRSEGTGPRAVHVTTGRLPAGVATRARADLKELGGPDGGRLAVIAPDALIPALRTAVPEAVPGDRPESLDASAALLTVSQAKGLEFDRVIVADPAGILSQSENGAHDLYVAITRATHRLTVVYDGDLPAPLRSLQH